MHDFDETLLFSKSIEFHVQDECEILGYYYVLLILLVLSIYHEDWIRGLLHQRKCCIIVIALQTILDYSLEACKQKLGYFWVRGISGILSSSWSKLIIWPDDAFRLVGFYLHNNF